MSIRRTALDVLSRPRMQEIAQRAGLEFKASATRTEMLDRVSRSHSIPFKSLLTHYLRDELKLACQRLQLDDRGRERHDLIKRVIAAERHSGTKKAKAKATAIAKSKVRTTTVSRSRGTSTFFNGAAQMEEPKILK